jgi:MYXO-CTERM domain-containing protein
MTTKNDDRQPSDNMELLKQQASACGPECGCHAAGPSGRKRWILGVIVLVAAAAFVARAVINNNGGSAAKAVSSFAPVSTAEQAPVPNGVSASSPVDVPITSDAMVWKEIGALADLNAIAAGKDAVFVFLPGKSGTSANALTEQVRGAAMKLESTLGTKIGIFTLKTSSRDYEQFAKASALPGVLAMVKGRGTSTVSGDITEAKLIQGYVAASRVAGSGGCCPSGGGGSKVCK